MAEARDFHCYFHVFENLENWTIPSDHARYVFSFKKPTIRVQQGKRIPSWMSEHPVFCSILKRLHDDHLYSTDPFWRTCGILKLFLKRPKKHTVLELSRKTPDSMGAKLLIASTDLRACRNGHLGTLVRCCEAWTPIENCVDPISFECVDFQRLSQIIANLTRENHAEREAEVRNLPWTQNRERRCTSQMENWTTCLVYQKTRALSWCCH